MATDVGSSEIASWQGAIARLISNRSIALVWVLVLALAPLPFIALRAQMLWGRPHYQFFPLVPLGAAVLAWGQCRRLGPLRPGRRQEVAPLAIASWLLLALASFLVSPWLGSMAALLMLAAAIAALGGATLLRCLLPAWAFLGLAVGLPLNVDQQLISRLQTMTSRVASLALDALGVFHVMEGNVIRVSGRAFGVEEACSGIYSLFAVLFCTLFFVLWARRPPIRAIVTMVAAACWVLGGNIVRVATVVYLETRWGVDVSEGWRHDLLSLVVFSTTLLLVASTDCLLDFWSALVWPWRASRAGVWNGATDQTATAKLMAPACDHLSALDLGAPTRLPGLGRTWLCSWQAAVSFAFLGLVQMVGLIDAVPWHKGADGRFANSWSGSINASGLQALKSDSLPARSGNFCREDFNTETRGAGSSVGEMSRYWRYQFGDSSAIVSIDFPLQGWHELTSCYLGQGWALVERERDRVEAAADCESGRPSIVVAKLAKGPGRNGYLLFCLFDERGNPVEPPGQGIGGHLRKRFASWMNLWTGNGKNGGAGPGSALLWRYQVQLFIESEYLLTATEQHEVRSFFQELLSAIRRQGPVPKG